MGSGNSRVQANSWTLLNYYYHNYLLIFYHRLSCTQGRRGWVGFGPEPFPAAIEQGQG